MATSDLVNLSALLDDAKCIALCVIAAPLPGMATTTCSRIANAIGARRVRPVSMP